MNAASAIPIVSTMSRRRPPKGRCNRNPSLALDTARGGVGVSARRCGSSGWRTANTCPPRIGRSLRTDPRQSPVPMVVHPRTKDCSHPTPFRQRPRPPARVPVVRMRTTAASRPNLAREPVAACATAGGGAPGCERQRDQCRCAGATEPLGIGLGAGRRRLTRSSVVIDDPDAPVCSRGAMRAQPGALGSPSEWNFGACSWSRDRGSRS
jgi:hypothetical protein